MKRFSKLIAVVLAIAVIICPMTIFAETSTSTNGYKIKANPNDANELMLTISSTDGFVAYDATVTFNRSSDFQSTYGTGGAGEYDNGLKLISYEVDGGEGDSHNLPTIYSSMPNATTLRLIIIKNDFSAKGMYTELVIGIRVAAGSTATLTKIQAADEGTVAEDPTLLTFPAANESTGEIDQTAEYAKENATTVHTHNLTLHPAVPATCTAAGNSEYYTCSGCDKIFSDSQGTDEIQDATIAALGHNMTYHPEVESTCKVKGNIEYYYCSRCKKNFAEETGITELTAVEKELAAHTPSNTKKFLKSAATCGDDAIYYQECSVCGEQLNTTWIDLGSHNHVDHKFGEYVSDGNATCTADGTKTRRCSECGTTDTVIDTGSARGHNFETYTPNGNGTHTAKCTRCEETDTQKCNTNGNDGACSVCGYKATPAEPVLDTSLASTLYSKTVQITSKVGTFFTLYMPDVDYDSFEFIVSKPELLAPSYTYTGDTVDTVFNPTNYGEGSAPEYHLYAYSYSNIGLFEMGSEISCTLYIIKGGNRVSYYTWDTFKLADLVQAYYDKNTSNAQNAGIAVAILNLGTAAQVHFGAQATKAGYVDNTLATMPALNESVDQSLAPDYGELSTFTTVKDPQIYSTSIQLLAAPSLLYTVYDAAMTATCKNPANVTIQACYTSGLLGNVVTTVNGADLLDDDKAGAEYGMYTYSFSDVALYDTDKVVTFTFSGTDGTSYSCQSTLMTLIANHLGDGGTAGEVYNALATLAVAASNKFN